MPSLLISMVRSRKVADSCLSEIYHSRPWLLLTSVLRLVQLASCSSWVIPAGGSHTACTLSMNFMYEGRKEHHIGKKSFSWRPSKMFAQHGAGGFPIAVPEICIAYVSLNLTMLFLITISNALINIYAWQWGKLSWLSMVKALITAMAESVLMVVYIDTASAVHNLEPGGKTKSSMISLKTNESLKYVSKPNSCCCMLGAPPNYCCMLPPICWGLYCCCVYPKFCWPFHCGCCCM